MSFSIQSVNDDPLYFDRDGLLAITTKSIVDEGLGIFRDHRVLSIDQDETRLWATIEDEEIDTIPCDVQIEIVSDGKLSLSCDCKENHTEVCIHQVAALYAYADSKESSDQLFCATETAITERIKRGREEVHVDHVEGDLWFGGWKATSSSATTHFPRKYNVTIRNLNRRANICSCPDFQVNQLGTCKHIEAVLHKIRKHTDYKQFKEMPVPVPYLFLAWDVEDAPQLFVHRSHGSTTELNRLLDNYFDAEGGFIGRVPDDFFRLAELVENRSDLHIGRDAKDYAHQIAASATHRKRAEKIRSQIIATNGRIPGVNAKLYPYQIEGAAFMAGMGRALLADDMGLGKTLQAIAAATWLKEHEGVTKTLIICPASLKQQWAREIERFTNHDVQVIQGPASERSSQYKTHAPFLIMNYELVLRDRTLLTDELNPDLVIMDEAQRIKNWRTKIASAVKQIPSRYAFILSGTPLENRLEDLYSLMQVVDQKILGPLWRYMIDFHVTDERGKVLGYRNLSQLRKRIQPVMLRRDRRLVSDQLPDRIVQRIDVGMTTAQRDLHDDAMSTAGLLARRAKKRPLTPSERNRLMATLQQARMACDAAGLVDKKTEGSPKIDELMDVLEELCAQSGLKAVVFSQWERMTRMIENRLRKSNIGTVRLHGGVPTAQRGALMDRFREDDSVRVFISTDAGGVGLNLQSASILINMDIPWNPAVLEQRNGRIHRLGQTRKVQIINMVTENSYEEQVFELAQNKQNLFDNVISEDATEDVVGVSKKLLEVLISELNKTDEILEGVQADTEITAELDQTLEAILDDQTIVDSSVNHKEKSPAEKEIEEQISLCIEELQKAFGSKTERILGYNGGLLAVLDTVDEIAEATAERLSKLIPVGVIDRLTMKSLARLNASSAEEPHEYYNIETKQNMDQQHLSPLALHAQEKIKAAKLLIDQQMTGSAMDLIIGALLNCGAARAGCEMPLNRDDVTVWAYSEALPKNILSKEEVELFIRSLGLAQSRNIPDLMIQQLLQDAENFISASMPL